MPSWESRTRFRLHERWIRRRPQISANTGEKSGIKVVRQGLPPAVVISMDALDSKNSGSISLSLCAVFLILAMFQNLTEGSRYSKMY